MAVAPSVIASAAQTGLGLYQTIKGADLQRQLKRPTRNEVGAMEDYLQSTQAGLAETAPGTDFAKNEIRRTTAATMRTARNAAPSGAALSSLVSGAQESSNRAVAGETARQEQFGERMRRIRQTALRQKGLAELRDWEYNQARKFEEEAAAAEGMIGAGLQNIVPGLGNLESGYMAKQKSKYGVNPFTGKLMK